MSVLTETFSDGVDINDALHSFLWIKNVAMQQSHSLLGKLSGLQS